VAPVGERRLGEEGVDRAHGIAIAVEPCYFELRGAAKINSMYPKFDITMVN
jgi:hypothetical protein